MKSTNRKDRTPWGLQRSLRFTGLSGIHLWRIASYPVLMYLGFPEVPEETHKFKHSPPCGELPS
jgi:hypothetical protein